MHPKFSRRQFLKTSALAATAVTLGSPRSFVPAAPVPEHIGLQLYSLRTEIVKDPAGILAAVAKTGYREVEAYGYQEGRLFGLPYAEFGKLLRDNGLQMHSTHAGLTLADFDEKTGDIRDQVKRWIDAAPGLGLKYLICPFMEIKERPEIARLVKLYTAAGRYCKQNGIRFGYHNHEFEFLDRGPDQRLLIEWLLHEVDPALMCFELDLCWVTYAKNNATDWFRLYPGRWELCHAKDLAEYGKRQTIEVGDGVVDFKNIFQKSKEAGLKYYVVELEDYLTTPLEGVAKARQGLLKMF